MKELFQHKAGEPFQGGGNQKAAQKQQRNAAAQGEQAGQHGGRAKAVHRAPGAVEEPPVDELSRDQGVKGHLQAPAQNGVSEKNKKCLVHSGPLLVKWFVWCIIVCFWKKVQRKKGNLPKKALRPGRETAIIDHTYFS